jgi:hypothetical protein
MSADQARMPAIRQVSDAEVDHIAEHGWVFLPGLIEPEVAARLLAKGKAFVGPDFTGRAKADGQAGYSNVENPRFANYYRPAFEDDLCASISQSSELGRNAALLLGRDMPIRYHSDLIAVKLPKDMKSSAAGSQVTEWHQDVKLVRSTCISFWIALTENTPEMGTMRYYDGSHRLGELYPPVEEWPRVRELPLSEPLHYQPGDATAHVTWAVHGAPQNLSDNPRWAYIAAYLPSDAPFLGIPSIYTDEYVAAGEIQAGKPLHHPKFPVVYDPAMA